MHGRAGGMLCLDPVLRVWDASQPQQAGAGVKPPLHPK